MHHQPQRTSLYHSILVAQGKTERSRRALDFALWTARATRARLTLYHLYGRKLPRFHPDPIDEVREELEKRRRHCEEQGIAARLLVSESWSKTAIAREAMWYDLVVVGKKGKEGNANHRSGSMTRTLISISPVPVLIVDEDCPLPEKLMVVFDGTPDACRALRIASSLAAERQLELHITRLKGLFRSASVLQRAVDYVSSFESIRYQAQSIDGSKIALKEYLEANRIQLAFLPAIASSFSGSRMLEFLINHTKSSFLIPEGRLPPIF